MPTSTTPDGIVSPVVGDNLSPLASWFQMQGASVQAALAALRAEALESPLPDPISSLGPATQSVSATAWADLPNIDPITLDLPQACWVTITMGARIVAASSTQISASARVTGATSLSETQLEVGGVTSAYGQVIYSDASTGTRQANATRMVRLNAGSNVISARAYKTGSGNAQCSYTSLQVSPVRWA